MRIKLTILLLILHSLSVTAQLTVQEKKTTCDSSSAVKKAGAPGSSTKIIMRCGSTIQSGNDPLCVVDGVPYELDQIKSMNPNDIESIDILRYPVIDAIFSCNIPRRPIILITTKKANEKSLLSKIQKTGLELGLQQLLPPH